MTKDGAQARCDNLRRQASLGGNTYQVERFAEVGRGSRTWVVRQYRDNKPTGITYHS